MIKNIIITCLVFITVNYAAQTAKAIMPDAFFNCWRASYEEDDEKTNIKNYRPCDYKEFRAAMYRQSITFDKNGQCDYLQLAPNDAHFFVKGKWSYNKKRKMVTVKDDKDKVVYKFKVNGIEKSLTKIEYLEVK